MKTTIVILIAYLQLMNSLLSQDKLSSYLDDPLKQPVDMVIDVEHIKLNLEIDPYKQIIKGKQEMKFRTLRFGVDSLVFYASEMKFDKVSIDGVSADFLNQGNDIVVYNSAFLEHNKEYIMTIEFTGNPTWGLYFSGWNDISGKHRKQIFAHSPQGWMPFINQKHDLLTTEVIVKFDSKYKVFSNGDRVSVNDNGDGTRTWHYLMEKPHVIYLVCLGIGDWDYKETKSSGGTPMELWYYPDLPHHYEPTYAHSEYMIDFFEKEIGIKYPYSVYRQAPMVNYMYGGMETTTATVFGDYMHIPSRAWWMRNYVNVNSHELNHQWFGNLVSHLNNRHTWLTESFATHYAKVFERDLYGEDYYQWERDKELVRTFNAAKVNNNPVAHSYAGTDRWYPKGSLVLDMMRDVMSDSLFRHAIKYYTENNSFKVVETYDLKKAIRESTGISLDWFFDQWILRGGEPHFKLSYDYMQNSGGENEVLIYVDQIHKVDNLIGYFRVPASVHVYYKDGSVDSIRQWIDGQRSVIKVPNFSGADIDFVIFDPNRKIIKKVSFNRSYKESSAQAEKAKNMIDRYDALLELRNFPIDEKRASLHKIFSKEKFHLTKSEIIRQLAYDDKSINLMKTAISDNDVWVRRAVLESLTLVPEQLKNDYEKMLKDTCFINTELALRNLSASFPNQDYLEITKDEIGWRGRNIRMAWLEIALSKSTSDTELLNELYEYTTQSYEFETRINAFIVLKNLSIINSQIVKNALDAYLHWNFKLRDGAFAYLNFVFQTLAGKTIIEEEIAILKPLPNQVSSINSLKERLKK
ncbi:MAG: M1 family metallopeptidase [Candidatus Kapabacteria bacterium]|nr:M1 family metallopeptidase [Ignavibacteriota bacterium]MCW5885409.1 M1 family metallopeptidase [Candidatus Kapabacteria bacterium]